MKPNIVFILCDDLGWMDLTCYGSSFYETPHLDRLAEKGMRFICDVSKRASVSGVPKIDFDP